MHGLTDSKILVVEDDPGMCESIRYLLAFHGFDVQTSGTLMDALDVLLAIEYDLVLLDLKLEGKCGFAVMDHLEERNLDTRVIVVTGQHSESYAIKALKKGATDYLKKPFEPNDLLASVNKVLGKQKHQRELAMCKSVVAASSVAIVVGDQSGRVVYANGAYLKLINPDTVAVDRQFTDQADPNDTTGTVDQEIKAVLETGMPWEGMVDMVNAAGQQFVAWKRVDIISDAIGDTTYGFALMHDITAQLENEQALASSRERYRKVIDSQQEYLCRLNTDFEITFINKAYADYWQQTPRSMIGRSYMAFIQDQIQPALLKTLESVQSDPTPLEIEYAIADKDGNTRWQQWQFLGIFDEDGDVLEIQSVGRDVTRQKMIEKEAEKNQEKFRNFAEKRLREESDKLKRELTRAQCLTGILLICASCKMIRDDSGHWNQLETYIMDHSDAKFSHGICPQCAKRLYPELYEQE